MQCEVTVFLLFNEQFFWPSWSLTHMQWSYYRGHEVQHSNSGLITEATKYNIVMATIVTS